MTNVSKQDKSDLEKKLLSIGISVPYANQLANGRRTPSFKLALRIQDELGIDPHAWVQRETVDASG